MAGKLSRGSFSDNVHNFRPEGALASNQYGVIHSYVDLNPPFLTSMMVLLWVRRGSFAGRSQKFRNYWRNMVVEFLLRCTQTLLGVRCSGGRTTQDELYHNTKPVCTITSVPVVVSHLRTLIRCRMCHVVGIRSWLVSKIVIIARNAKFLLSPDDVGHERYRETMSRGRCFV